MTLRKKAAARRRGVAAVPVAPDTVALVAVLQAHALGEHEMTTSQVNVALSLLKLYAGQQVEALVQPLAHEDALQQLA